MRARLGYVLGIGLTILVLGAGCAKDAKLNAKGGGGANGGGQDTGRTEPYSLTVEKRDPELARFALLQFAHVVQDLELSLGYNNLGRVSLDPDSAPMPYAGCAKLQKVSPVWDRSPDSNQVIEEKIKKVYAGCKLVQEPLPPGLVEGDVVGSFDILSVYDAGYPRKAEGNTLGEVSRVEISNSEPLQISLKFAEDVINVNRTLKVTAATDAIHGATSATFTVDAVEIQDSFMQPNRQDANVAFRAGTILTKISSFTFVFDRGAKKIVSISPVTIETKIDSTTILPKKGSKPEKRTPYGVSTVVQLGAIQPAASLCDTPTGEGFQFTKTKLDGSTMQGTFKVADQNLTINIMDQEFSVPARLCKSTEGDLTLAEELESVVWK